ncbi:hypothetical protein WMF45_02600 [Sorangium sp. So ce448]
MESWLHVENSWQLGRSRERRLRQPRLLRGMGDKTLPKEQPPSMSSRWS